MTTTPDITTPADARTARVVLAARRALIEAHLRALSAHRDAATDVWTLHTVTVVTRPARGHLQAGYLEVLIDDEDGAVFLTDLTTTRRVLRSWDLPGTATASQVCDAITAAVR